MGQAWSLEIRCSRRRSRTAATQTNTAPIAIEVHRRQARLQLESLSLNNADGIHIPRLSCTGTASEIPSNRDEGRPYAFRNTFRFSPRTAHQRFRAAARWVRIRRVVVCSAFRNAIRKRLARWWTTTGRELKRIPKQLPGGAENSPAWAAYHARRQLAALWNSVGIWLQRNKETSLTPWSV